MTLGLHHVLHIHHEGVLHIHHGGVLHIQVGLVPPIIRAMAVLHIRVKVAPHIEAVHLVATEIAMDTEIIHHHRQAEISAIITITHPLCVQVVVVAMGHHILGVVWILHQLITMIDMDPLHHHIAMTGVPHPHLMDILLIIILLLLKEGAVDIMVVVVMVVTEVGLLPLHHITIPSGGTEHLETIFANFVVKLYYYACVLMLAFCLAHLLGLIQYLLYANANANYHYALY